MGRIHPVERDWTITNEVGFKDTRNPTQGVRGGVVARQKGRRDSTPSSYVDSRARAILSLSGSLDSLLQLSVSRFSHAFLHY